MNSTATLKTEAEGLCNDIQGLEQKLQAKAIAFDVAQQLWISSYRPRARILAEAMLRYVPSSDPRIQVEFEAGDSRVIKSDALICIEEPLSEELASAHLSIVTKQLRDLINDLPTEADM
jgi:hypothetical protein